MTCKCGKPVDWADEMALDQAKRDYPGFFERRPVCQKCFLEMDLRARIAFLAAQEGIDQQSLIREILDKYENLPPC